MAPRAAARVRAARCSGTPTEACALYIEDKEKTEDDAYWAESKNVAHHIAGGGPGALDGLTSLRTLNL